MYVRIARHTMTEQKLPPVTCSLFCKRTTQLYCFRDIIGRYSLQRHFKIYVSSLKNQYNNDWNILFVIIFHSLKIFTVFDSFIILTQISRLLTDVDLAYGKLKARFYVRVFEKWKNCVFRVSFWWNSDFFGFFELTIG